jgi:non-specific serine/threonine protein kinase/serine/threonine-protein kinase
MEADEKFNAEAVANDGGLEVEVEARMPPIDETGDLARTGLKEPTGALHDAPTIPLSPEEQSDLFREPDIGPYRIIERIGQGGMGDVYLAERSDDQFRKKVAIKLIRLGMDSEFVLKRFRNERQILASLEHPNIARLLDGGTASDGRPYFVMEYIEGERIDDYCDEQKLTTLQRLELFQKVCSAVHYAHQNLVIHRDIKPGNILVTEDGVPKLLDFGIAKLLNPQLAAQTIEATAAAVWLMTPDYASPEQAKGEPITTATDVYSLGVVLYELLTGHRPYQIPNNLPHEILRVICDVEPERPSTVVARTRTLPRAEGARTIEITPDEVSRTRDGHPDKLRRRLKGDLDNIVLMAMRKEPQRRYSSVSQLSNDIQRHLDGLPVVARADTFFYRSGKFVRRNKLGVLAAAVIFIVLIGGIVATTMERRKAERRFNDVRGLANSLLFEFHDAIKDLPGSVPARQLVVNKAIEYLDSLAREASSDPSLQRELATAYDKVGDLQGGLYQSNLGDTEGAKASYEKALRIREALSNREPSSEEVREALANSYDRLGWLNWTHGDPASAAEWHHKSLEIHRALSASRPDDLKRRFNTSASFLEYGFMLAASGKIDEGLEILLEGVTLFEEVTKADPSNMTYKDGLSIAYERVAMVFSAGTPRKDEGLKYFDKSLQIRIQLMEADPLNTDLRRGVAASYGNISETQLKVGDVAGAVESARKAVAMMTGLSNADPQNAQFRQDAAYIRSNLAAALVESGDAATGLTEGTQAREVLEKMLIDDPSSMLIKFRVAVSHEIIGGALLSMGSNKATAAAKRRQYLLEARSWYEKAHKVDRELRDNGSLAGDEAARVEVTAAKIEECSQELAKLK